jgi:3-methyladenine DNA glycosylase/8-oxoguanine DNA glycosylase
MPSRLTLRIPADFELFKAVCSYGHFLLAPNHWDRDKQRFTRPLRDAKNRVVRVTITQPERAATLKKRSESPVGSSTAGPLPHGRGSFNTIAIQCDRSIERADHKVIKAQVVRMLRTDDDMADWYTLHRTAKRRGFGRLFRSPTLFEDMIKTITSCNVAWAGTILMNKLLVEHVGNGAFPTPEEVADFGEERLKSRCKVGYRAGRIARLARQIVEGEVDLDWYEHPDRTSDETHDKLLKLHGIGPYAAANINMLIGFYDRLAIDTETYRHFCLSQKVERPENPKKLHDAIEAYYGKWSPYDFIAYWFELWQDYESRFGPSHKWDRDQDAKQFTAAALNAT